MCPLSAAGVSRQRFAGREALTRGGLVMFPTTGGPAREGTTMTDDGPKPGMNDPSEMDNLTLWAAWQITDRGRQYEGVEEDRREIGREMARRIKEGVDG